MHVFVPLEKKKHKSIATKDFNWSVPAARFLDVFSSLKLFRTEQVGLDWMGWRTSSLWDDMVVSQGRVDYHHDYGTNLIHRVVGWGAAVLWLLPGRRTSITFLNPSLFLLLSNILYKCFPFIGFPLKHYFSTDDSGQRIKLNQTYL